jgi:predicted 3-demethylubiquinone-9 3-methyltransferase (glyoxalase superfamily)
MQKITPFLWFDGRAEEAARFYCGIFNDAKITDIRHYNKAGPGAEGSVMTVTFELFGREYIALNGGPHFHFTPAVSFFVLCDTQDEIDRLWRQLGDGGDYNQCGWLSDKFGLSWQIVPRQLGEMLQDRDPAKWRRTMEAMLGMTKLDIAGLQRAYEGAAAA